MTAREAILVGLRGIDGLKGGPMKPKTIIAGSLLAFVVFSVGHLIFKELGNDTDTAEPEPRNQASTSETVPDENSATAPTEDTEAAQHTVVAYYFHGNVRCQTCRKIEAYTAESITTALTNEIFSGQLEWKIVNVDETPNEHFLKDYQLTSRAVVLVDTVKGEQVKWKNLTRIWDMVGDKAEFQKYIIEETRGYLQKGSM